MQNSGKIYGYTRVSTDGQSIDAQVRQLRAAGAATVFPELASGAKADRAQLGRLLAQLDAGDVLMAMRRKIAPDGPGIRGMSVRECLAAAERAGPRGRSRPCFGPVSGNHRHGPGRARRAC